MVELQHRATEPAELTAFRAAHPAATVSDFNSLNFRSAKAASKSALNADQAGLCAYCEKKLSATEGQIDHIKPKGGTSAYPHLCFNYTNYAHSCVCEKTCGQKKKSGVLPIEPGPGCNAEWTLSTDGTIEPRGTTTRVRRHAVRQTRDMLGLNADPDLVDERKRWLSQAVAVLKATPTEINLFLQQAPFRYMLATVV